MSFTEKINLILNTGKVPTVDQFYTAMDKKVQPGALLFWSALGSAQGLSSREAAIEYAKEYHLQLLRHLMPDTYPEEDIFNKFKAAAGTTLTYNTRAKLQDITWKRASQAFAKHAQFNVKVILKGPAANGVNFPHPDDCWVVDEWPLLRANPNVRDVIRVNADNWNDTMVIFQGPNQPKA